MSKYLVSYDLHSPHRDYEPLTAALKKQPRWVRALESVWVIWSNGDASVILAYLRQFIDADDSLLVLRLADVRDGAWVRIPPEAEAALTANW